LVDSDTKDGSRLNPEASGIRKPPRPPLRVGLATQDHDRFGRAAEAYARLYAILKKRNEKSQQDGNDLFEV